MINRQRLEADLLDMIRISSPSKREGQMAKRLRATFEGLGVAVEEDDAGRQVGGEVGNLLAKFPGTAPSAPPLLLCAHMDTVVPCENVKPVVAGDVVKTDGTTVLGGD
ncbi:MAG: peptidase M20, partial [Candidatus Rokubacteria bacterium]|nr:peptidase M20 [Candidatus Rokubacteria bacterium]